MIIAIDIDDVLSDTITTLTSYYNSLYSPKITAPSLERNSYWSFLGDTREEANEKFFDFVASDFFEQIEPNPGSIDAINSLSEKNELVLITGRPLFSKDKTEKWVAQYFPGVFKGIYFTNERINNKDFSPYWGRKKAVICDELGAEVLVDDLFDYIDGTDHLRVILFDQVWNRVGAPAHVERAVGWGEVANLLL